MGRGPSNDRQPISSLVLVQPRKSYITERLLVGCKESNKQNSEGSGSVVECLTRDPEAAGSRLTGVTALCP